MEVLRSRNNHLFRKYGCICSVCGMSFIFMDEDVNRARRIDQKPDSLTIRCPNTKCEHITMLEDNSVVELLNDEMERIFRTKYGR